MGKLRDIQAGLDRVKGRGVSTSNASHTTNRTTNRSFTTNIPNDVAPLVDEIRRMQQDNAKATRSLITSLRSDTGKSAENAVLERLVQLSEQNNQILQSVVQLVGREAPEAEHEESHDDPVVFNIERDNAGRMLRVIAGPVDPEPEVDIE